MLKNDSELVWSDIVVNSRMNRSRTSSGVNSYEQEFGFKPENLLLEILNLKKEVKWLDICCGEGRAILKCASFFKSTKRTEGVYFRGIDLVDAFVTSEHQLDFVEFSVGSFNQLTILESFDLITCVHGLHYIGDKLESIRKAVSLLSEDGLFIANLDFKNIRITNTNSNLYLLNSLNKNGFKYDTRKKIVSRRGRLEFSFELEYIGANDNFGPNYTGQDSVESLYNLI